jgi:hypothetical protein
MKNIDPSGMYHRMAVVRTDVSEKRIASCPEDGGDTSLRNVGSNHNHTVLHHRRRYSSNMIPSSGKVYNCCVFLHEGYCRHVFFLVENAVTKALQNKEEEEEAIKEASY